MVAATSDNLGSLARLLTDKLGRDTNFVSNTGVLLGAVNETEERRKHESAYLQVWREQAGSITRRSEEHTSELQSLMRISYAVFCLKKKKQTQRSSHDTLSMTHNMLGQYNYY